MATVKQKRAFKKVLENGGNVSRAMRESGYRKGTAKNPKKLTESKAWNELMEEYFPEEVLAKVHKDGLKARRKENRFIDRDDKGRPIYDFVDVDDYATRHKYLDTAYKLRGLYAPEKKDIKVFSASALLSEINDDNQGKPEGKGLAPQSPLQDQGQGK